MEDFKVRVHNSMHTPPWVEWLRETLVSTMLNGDHLRVVNFRTSVRFHSVQTVDDLAKRDADEELTLSCFLENHQVRNADGWMYSARSLTAILWSDDALQEGSLSLMSERAKWLYVPQPDDPKRRTFGARLRSVLCWPETFLHVIRHPESLVDLHLLSAQINFDQFRIQDADLVVQMGNMVRNKWNNRGDAFDGLVWDSVVKALATK